MMIDCEETSRNSHAITRHPEIESWTEAQYSRSGYKLRADEAKAALQGLLDSEGIDFIELNPHRDSVGEFDNRVDAYGRYVGLVYGDDKCLNAAMVELGHADVYLYEDGRYLVPEMELKDYLSYSSAQDDSIEATDVVMNALDVSAGLYEILTALAYAADGFIWSVDPRLAVSFRRAEQPDHVWFFNPVAMGVTLGSDSTQVANTIYFEGNPLEAAVKKTYQSAESLATYGERARDLVLYSISSELDADQLIEGLLKDLAYPEPSGAVVCFRGHGAVQVGDIVELRGGPLRRLEPEVDGEWDDRFRGRLVGRVREVTHRFEGKHAVTTVQLTSPLRSVQNPIDSMTRSQPDPETFFQFRLDDTVVGLDLQFHLD
ncbi:MAG: thermonuclease family protein [Candidatus Hydrogenedentes bacterium]|nr:thermonuclease family protein [Candidatus Hydrogenedentota bacterium]